MKANYKLKSDELEIKSVVSDLKLKSLKGSGNKCKNCNKTGYFGSIERYICKTGNVYQICGWCFDIRFVTKEKK